MGKALIQSGFTIKKTNKTVGKIRLTKWLKEILKLNLETCFACYYKLYIKKNDNKSYLLANIIEILLAKELITKGAIKNSLKFQNLNLIIKKIFVESGISKEPLVFS